MARIFISANSSWNIVNFRAGLVRALHQEGHELYFLTPSGPSDAEMCQLQGTHLTLPMKRDSVNPFVDIFVLLSYLYYMIRYRPSYYLAFTSKPNIYGGIASRLAGVKPIHNISGLGYVFIKGGFLKTLVISFYRRALKKAHHVFFQNADDKALFEELGILRTNSVSVLPGSGVDVEAFQPIVRPNNDRFTFLMVARLLVDKGVREYAEAARILKAQGLDVCCQLLGPLDSLNPAAIRQAELDQWVEEGILSYLGETHDICPYWQAADCAILPSYLEGAPRTLIEAGAVGLPSITTDVPGCRFVVKHNETGFLVPARAPESLAEAMMKMVNLPQNQKDDMGRAARLHIVENFSETKVIDAYHSVIGTSNGTISE